MSVLNPFTYGNPIAEPSRFFGRRQEVEQIFSRLRNPEFESTSIVGERRLGKTSLLNFVSHPDVIQRFGLDLRSYLFIYLDLQMVGAESTPSRLFQYVLRRIAARVEDAALQAQLSDISQQATLDAYDLADVFDTVDRKKLYIVLLMDEFENISNNPNFGPEFYYTLRSLAIHHKLALITASRNELVEISRSAEVRSSPFFNIFATVNLQPFARTDMEELPESYLSGTGVSFSAAAIDHVVKLAGLHPYFLQAALWLHFEGRRRQLSGPELENFVESAFLRQAQPNLEVYWQHSDDGERMLLALLALLDIQEGGHERLRSAGELQRWHRRAGSLLNSLARRGLLTRVDEAYALFSAAFSQWIVTEITSPSLDLAGSGALTSEEEVTLASLPRQIGEQVRRWTAKTSIRYRSLILTWLSDPLTAEAVLRLLVTSKAPFQEAGGPAGPVTSPLPLPAPTTAPPSSIRVYLAEGQALFRESLRTTLGLEPDPEVVGEAAEARQALQELDVLGVDVVLMDVALPDGGGIDAARKLKQRHPHLSVVMLTSSEDEHLADALDAGASGCLLKSCTPEQLAQGLRAASRGQTLFDPLLTGKLARQVAELRHAQRESILTERQVEILRQVASGMHYRDIAASLFLSETTVNREMRNIFDRLGVNDAAHAISEAYRGGIL